MDETKFDEQFIAEQRELEQSAKGLSWVIEGAGTDYIVAAANHYPAALDAIERLHAENDRLRARAERAEAEIQRYRDWDQRRTARDRKYNPLPDRPAPQSFYDNDDEQEPAQP
jgi:molecular chaperone GrpE (heat shock protein)